jgi:hypothetical protein
VSPLSTDDEAKCGGRLGICAKQRGVVRGSAKWSEVFAKCLEKVHRCAWVIEVGRRYLWMMCDVDRVGETMWNDRDDSRR